MNKEETLALYSQGKDAWNAWAYNLLEHREESKAWNETAKADFTLCNLGVADFSEFIFPGDVLFARATFKSAATFQKAKFTGSARFEGATFKESAGFEGAIFKGNTGFTEATFEDSAWFEKATFEGVARFQKAKFTGSARFWKATFSGNTVFREATFKSVATFREATFKSVATFREAAFKGDAGFTDATFEGNAGFEGATFKGAALFGLSTFERPTNFYSATFHAETDFKAVQGNSVFTMADAEFMEVPDFQQASFVEVLRLDNVKIEPQLSRRDKLKAFFTKGDLEKEGRWRALKRLATQGHDHASEQLFFRGELLARRGVTDKYRHLAFWLGMFYQLFSDFGRSLMRPLLWWVTGILVFAARYLSHHPGSSGWWLSECIAGSSKPWVSALGLSVHKSLPAVSGFGFGDKLPQFHACLYGVESENPFRPIIPDEVAFLGVLQVLFSAVMIFLFLLAVRNHFRIR